MGDIIYDGKHSIVFEKELLDEKKDTYKDFHLAPTSRPVINPPKQKTNYIDVPGMNGHIDASEILTGYPVFENRTGSLSFYVMNGFEDWYTIYNKILEFFHGRTMTFRLTDEPDYFYKGRMSVNKWESKKENSEITLDYSVEPYKWAVLETTDDWLWDTFDFEEGIIGTDLFSNVSYDTTEYQKIEIDPWFIGNAPVCPVINVSSMTSQLSCKIVNHVMNYTFEHELIIGDNQFPDVIFHRDDFEFYIKGTGVASIIFRKGIL